MRRRHLNIVENVFIFLGFDFLLKLSYLLVTIFDDFLELGVKLIVFKKGTNLYSFAAHFAKFGAIF